MKGTNLKLRQLIREAIKEQMDPREVNVFGYETQHFDVCPGAQGLYKRIVEENLVQDQDLVIRSAKLHDVYFASLIKSSSNSFFLTFTPCIYASSC